MMIFIIEAFNNELSKTNIKFNFGINARLDLFYNDLPLIEICQSIEKCVVYYLD
jgi:hypothetical protein